jgi:3-hydroxyisobutyrate dehydrogenase
MGARMAGRLLAAGHDLTVYNRSRQRLLPLRQAGARTAGTPHELAAVSDVVLSCVADEQALEEVLLGPDGALAGARQGTLFIDLSTVSPAACRSLAQQAQARGHHFLDAPVSGSTPQAERGELVIYVGGDEENYERARPIIGVLGRQSFYMGASGSGAKMKLCVNTLLGLGMQALAEAIALGLKGGLEQDRLLEVLGQTSVLSPSQRSKLPNFRTGVYAASFPLRLMDKDYRLIRELADELSVPMPATTAARHVCTAECVREVAAGRDEDFSAVIRAVEHKGGVKT